MNTVAYYLLQFFPSHFQTTEQISTIVYCSQRWLNNPIPKRVFPMNFSKKIFTKVIIFYLYI